MFNEFDWRKSEETYWGEYGSLEELIAREQVRDKRERRGEMKTADRLVDHALELLFPRRYREWHTHDHQLPPMRLYYRDGSPSNFFLKHPLPRFVPKNGKPVELP